MILMNVFSPSLLIQSVDFSAQKTFSSQVNLLTPQIWKLRPTFEVVKCIVCLLDNCIEYFFCICVMCLKLNLKTFLSTILKFLSQFMTLFFRHKQIWVVHCQTLSCLCLKPGSGSSETLSRRTLDDSKIWPVLKIICNALSTMHRGADERKCPHIKK